MTLYLVRKHQPVDKFHDRGHDAAYEIVSAHESKPEAQAIVNAMNAKASRMLYTLGSIKPKATGAA